jgi:hypothetical protein
VLVNDEGTRVIIPNNAITTATLKVFAAPMEQAGDPPVTGAHAA